jgi:hypothetical protein
MRKTINNNNISPIGRRSQSGNFCCPKPVGQACIYQFDKEKSRPGIRFSKIDWQLFEFIPGGAGQNYYFN